MIDASLSLAVLMIGSVRDADASGRYVLHCFFEEKRNWFEACREKKEGLHCVFEMTKHVNSSAYEQYNLMVDVFFGFSSKKFQLFHVDITLSIIIYIICLK